MDMYNDSPPRTLKTGGPGDGEFLHPEFVFSTGTRFLSRWAEQNLRSRLEVFETTLQDIASGRISPEDAQDRALGALREAERRTIPLA